MEAARTERAPETRHGTKPMHAEVDSRFSSQVFPTARLLLYVANNLQLKIAIMNSPRDQFYDDTFLTGSEYRDQH